VLNKPGAANITGFFHEHTVRRDHVVVLLAPDVFVRVEPRGELIRSWKVWERGAPDVAIEIVSDWDAPAASWQQKLQRDRQLGVRELLRFDPQAKPEHQLRVWDRVGDVLCERQLDPTPAPRVPSRSRAPTSRFLGPRAYPA
jgi:Uma2 family endonuclease